MIPVQLKPEPSDFNTKVRLKGLAFLEKEPNPKKWKNRDYWTKSIIDLRHSYSSICAYSSTWIPEVQGTPTVDHFEPKSIAPGKAYEWSNFRLSCHLLNTRKGDYQDVLDPFDIQHEWFILHFPSLQIKANPSLNPSVKTQVINTINRLKLNDEDSCIQSRENWLKPFCQREYGFDYLRSKAPFIAYELERQNLIDKIGSIMYVKQIDDEYS
jgi:hypothetical protein